MADAFVTAYAMLAITGRAGTSEVASCAERTLLRMIASNACVPIVANDKAASRRKTSGRYSAESIDEYAYADVESVRKKDSVSPSKQRTRAFPKNVVRAPAHRIKMPSVLRSLSPVNMSTTMYAALSQISSMSRIGAARFKADRETSIVSPLDESTTSICKPESCSISLSRSSIASMMEA